MSLERFFLEQPPADGSPGGRVLLLGDEAHHLHHVRRVRIGDEVALFDGSGTDYVARVVSFDRGGAVLEITRVEVAGREPAVDVTLAVSVLKQQGMDQLVDTCTQLGMKRLIPMRTGRTVVKPGGNKTERWRRIAIEACKQCGRSVVPEVEAVCDLAGVIARVRTFGFAAIASLRAKQTLLSAVPKCESVLILVGPEGDFTPEEEQAALDAGCVPVSLAAGVLRAETAAAAALAVVIQAAERRVS